MGRESKLTTFGLSLNGKLIRNKIMVNFNDEYAVADLNGLYLMDKQQESETEINVYHNKPNCSSNQLFKGILDDVAKSSFVGHVYVDYGARGTTAMQNNKNMLLTDKAKVNTRPFLEIYNDDVKCSHGATIGQLNADALFYLRTRCISERSAKMLLMYAFCEDVLSKSDIEELKESLGDLIKKRLQGELTACGNCVFQCSKPCK
jgi:Fe-S cluster assembly protein SufD